MIERILTKLISGDEIKPYVSTSHYLASGLKGRPGYYRPVTSNILATAYIDGVVYSDQIIEDFEQNLKRSFKQKGWEVIEVNGVLLLVPLLIYLQLEVAERGTPRYEEVGVYTNKILFVNRTIPHLREVPELEVIVTFQPRFGIAGDNPLINILMEQGFTPGLKLFTSPQTQYSFSQTQLRN